LKGEDMFKGKKEMKKQETAADLARRAEKAAERSDRLSNFALGFSIFVLILRILSNLIDHLEL
jgi:hypothetical protein